ncbi:hypothetical protein IE81DRAFT_365168 [Ceraceosorus guamensis]|uniref:chorismate mutase n=1 Tax=Ceraceosorus guamensis TaxID=1522189 RepID=A0A316W2W1_9BASI|nr:hypothetical protein IE81DRAFT_365168 [Ceraceosorus guamensis]PWN44206.1 hypothetical protein IE81DRAFT_365168 [Ceraceosorus guamensis]
MATLPDEQLPPLPLTGQSVPIPHGHLSEDDVSLAAVRSALDALQQSIVHSVLARAALPLDGRTIASEKPLLKAIFAASYNSSIDSDLPERLFASIAPDPPYLYYIRDGAAAERYGDREHHSSPKDLIDAYYQDVLPHLLRRAPENASANVEDGQTQVPNVSTLTALASAQVLQSLSARVHLGRAAGQAKYLADPLSYCDLAKRGNVVALRDKVRNKAQEQSVLRKLYSQMQAWSHTPNFSGDSKVPTLNFTVPATINPLPMVELYRM